MGNQPTNFQQPANLFRLLVDPTTGAEVYVPHSTANATVAGNAAVQFARPAAKRPRDEPYSYQRRVQQRRETFPPSSAPQQRSAFQRPVLIQSNSAAQPQAAARSNQARS